VVHAFARRHPPATQLKLIDRRPLAPYSGMLPGLIAGHYSVRESHIDLAALCRWAGVEFVQAEAVAIDLDRHTVITAPGGTHGYDLLSIDTGSTPPLDAIAGAREHALAVKPIDSFLAAMERRLPQLARKPGASLAVIGAGAAGFEVVLALQFRCCARFGRRTSPTFKLVADGDTILPGFPERARRIAERRLREQGIELHAGSAACVVDAAGLRLASGTHVPADQIVLATGAQAPPLYRESGLQTDAKGFIAVDAALRSRSHRAVFACGDIAAVLEHPAEVGRVRGAPGTAPYAQPAAHAAGQAAAAVRPAARSAGVAQHRAQARHCRPQRLHPRRRVGLALEGLRRPLLRAPLWRAGYVIATLEDAAIRPQSAQEAVASHASGHVIGMTGRLRHSEWIWRNRNASRPELASAKVYDSAAREREPAPRWIRSILRTRR
jgi:selenide,water dikinase